MKETISPGMRHLPSNRLLGTGASMCAGCGGLQALHRISEILGDKNVFVNTAGCVSSLSAYPFTPFRGNCLYTAMASAGAEGVRSALDILKQQGKSPEAEDLQVVVLTGDGAAYGTELSATSGAIERNLDFLYICYDTDGYSGTGQQVSKAIRFGKQSYPGYKKDLFAIWAAHKPAYAATAIATEPQDLACKLEKAISLKGPRFILALAPCPSSWEYDSQNTTEISKLAVNTGVWPLKEYIDGKVVHTRSPREREPVEVYLKSQGRFRHLFEPIRNDRQIAEIQSRIDQYWHDISAE